MKTKIILITAILALMNILPPLQAQQFTANKEIIDSAASAQAYAIAKTNDHHYLIAGSKDSSGLVVKMDSTCSILWSKKYEYPGGVSFYTITATNDDSFVLTSLICNTVQANNILLMKINADGDTLWSKEIDLGAWCTSVLVELLNDGGFILAGDFFLQNQRKTFFIRLDATGDLVWFRIYSASFYWVTYTVRQMPDNGFIVAGYLQDPWDFEPYVLKLTSAGVVEWAKKITSSQQDRCYDVAVTTGGLLWYISDDFSLMIVKTDFNGNSISGKRYWQRGTALSDQVNKPKLHPVSTGGFIGALSSTYLGDAGLLVKIDSSGNLIWAQSTVMYATDVVESDDKGFVIAGNGLAWQDKFVPVPQHIGVNKTDSLGNCPGWCVYPYTVQSSSFWPVMAYVTFTSETGSLTINKIHPQVSSTPLISNDTCVTIVGIKENQPDNTHLTVFPNPSKGIFQININYPDPGKLKRVEIYDFSGKIIYQSTDREIFRSPEDLSFLPDGIYTMRIVFPDKIFTDKIIICR
jgi:hypothetical protein